MAGAVVTRSFDPVGVLPGVRGIPLEAVNGHEPPGPEERPGGQFLSNRDCDLGEQCLQRLVSQPLAGLGNTARRRHAPPIVPAPPRHQRLSQPGRDLFIVILGYLELSRQPGL
jgi:hypothetical protein